MGYCNALIKQATLVGLFFFLITDVAQSQPQDPNYFFQQNQGRFVPFAPPAGGASSAGRSQQQQQQPGSYQEQTLFVNNNNNQNNGPVPAPSNDQSFFQFPFSPPRHQPDIFEISPRPFAVQPLPNNGFQFQRTNNGFNIPPPPPPPPVRRPDYLDTIGAIKREPPQTLQQHNKNRQPPLQADATLANSHLDGSSALSSSNNYLSQRGRGQINRESEPVDILAGGDTNTNSGGDFVKKSRVVTEYYNSQEQQQPPFRSTATNVRSRNQFAGSNKDGNNEERDNNQITQFGSRDQQQPRTDGRAPTPPQQFPSRNAKKVLQNRRPVNRNHIPFSPRINITHNGSAKFANELLPDKAANAEDEELDYYYDSNEAKTGNSKTRNGNNQLYGDAYYEDVAIPTSSIRPPRKQVIIRRQKGDRGINTATATTTTTQVDLDELEDNDPQIITSSSEVDVYDDLDYIVPPKVISTTEAPKITTTTPPPTTTTTTPATTTTTITTTNPPPPPARTRPTTTTTATEAPIPTTTESENSKVLADGTVILTSGFYLPKENTEEELDEDQNVEVSTEPIQRLDRTTEGAGDEEYYEEYEEEGEQEDENIPDITTAASTSGEFNARPTNKPSRSRDTILGEQVVQVVTTKSVVNGTTVTNNPNKVTRPQDKTRTTTEGYVVVASVQTSRSVSGARFLPFPQVEQEEKKQTLADLEKLSEEERDDPLLEGSYDHAKNSELSFDLTTAQPSSVETSTSTNRVHSTSTNIPVPPAQSTESIIDKLDRVQSELSSGVLSGKFPVLDDTTESTTVRPNQVVIKKFTPRTTTHKPVITSTPRKPDIKKFQVETTTPQDELESLLPPGFKNKFAYKKKPPTSTEPTARFESSTRNASIGRSYKNGKVGAQELSIPGFSSAKGVRVANNPESATTTTAPTTVTIDKPKNSTLSLLDRVEKVDISAFLPPGFKLDQAIEGKPVPEVVIQSDISQFLPPGYKPPSSTAEKSKPPAVVPLPKDKSSVESTTEKKLVTVLEDNAKFLPHGYKVSKYSNRKDLPSTLSPEYKPEVKVEEKEKAVESIIEKLLVKDVSALLPPGYKPDLVTESSVSSSTSTASNNNAGKVVFPTRSYTAKKPGQQQRPGPHKSAGPPPPVIGIRKGPPTRATTEFTGWPSPPTTPFSIEKLLEQQKVQSIDISELLKGVTSSSTTSATTTTRRTTPTTTARPTKPGVCRRECDLAGTIKLVDGIRWKPEYLDHNTQEWKTLAQNVETELNEVYSKSKELKKWFKKVRIDSFSKGSVLVDYFVELNNITGTVDTLEIKKLFHESLLPMHEEYQADDPVNGGLGGDESFDRIVEQRENKDSYMLGRYVVDPVATDFIVIPKVISPTLSTGEENNIVPQWAVVVMVVGLVSLLFVIIFGVTVLVNRKKQAQKKAPTPLTADMLNELNKNHMGGIENYGADEMYNVDDNWGDDYNDYKPKRFGNSMHGSGSNIYDSWRSQHHPDYYYDSHHYPHKPAYPPDMFVDPNRTPVPMYTYNPRRPHRDYEDDF